MSGWSLVVFVLALSAACCLGMGYVLQQHAAQRAPRSDVLTWRLLLDLARMPDWLLGLAFVIGGLVLSTLALDRGHVALVEPLLASNLLFAMALARVLTGQSLGRMGWGGVVLLGSGVTAFVVAGRPQGGEAEAGPLRYWLVIGVLVGLAVFLVSVARRLPLFEEATLLALAAGLLYGLQDAFTRVTTQVLEEDGFTAVTRIWQPYAALAIGAVGLLLVQSAFEVAPLKMSLPALTAAQPLAGIACAVGFLGDRVRLTPGALAWEAAGLVCVVLGVILIGRHPAMPRGGGRARGNGRRGGGDGGRRGDGGGDADGGEVTDEEADREPDARSPLLFRTRGPGRSRGSGRFPGAGRVQSSGPSPGSS